MTVARTDSAAVLRGTAVGTLTAALAVAAHSTAGGAVPVGAAVVVLAVLAASLGAIAAVMPGAARATVLWTLLGSGQLLAHVLLTGAGHWHGPRPGLAMLGAHLVAVTAGASLIACGGRLWSALSRVVRALSGSARIVPEPARYLSAHEADQPLHSALLLAASVSHRGPPAGVTA